MKPYILIVDDEPDIRRVVREILEDEGYAVAVAKDGQAARESVKNRVPNLVLLDIWMPDIDGISLLKEFVNDYHMKCPVVMMSGHGTVEAAVEATRLGAHDFIEKPLSLSKLLLTVEQGLASAQRSTKQTIHFQSIAEQIELVGKSQTVQELKKHLEDCAIHDVTLLVTGEPGVGKSHCSRYVHSNSQRKSGPYVELHTATFVGGKQQGVELLLGSDRLGQQKAGYLEQASSGTLFIDDVGELDHDTQTALYGALTSPAVYRVGGDEPINVDVRVIAATRYDLEQEIRMGRFREDLYYCLNAYPIHVPSLKEHSEDVTELLDYYVRLFADKEGLTYRSFSVAAQNALRNHSWPGNILELEYFVRRLLMKGGEPSIELEEVNAMLDESANNAGGAPVVALPEYDMPLRQAREQFEKDYLIYHLSQAGGSVGKVAKLVGMERTHLYRKLKALGIDAKNITQESKGATD